MKTLHFDIEKAKQLEDSIGFLSNYLGSGDDTIEYTISKNGEKLEFESSLLLELAEINKKRLEILNHFK